MAQYDYDLFVIGAGSGGVRAARLAAMLGKKVAVAEEHRVGGTCVIRGCVPKKLMVYASEFAHAFETAKGFGWTVPAASFDWAKFIAAKDAEISRLSGIYMANLSKAGVDIVHARAVLKDAHTLEIVGKDMTVTAETILIATGGRPYVPADLPGAEHAITSEEAFHLPALPKSIMIAGGGYIGVEFACIFAGLGVDVQMVVRSPNILRGFDDEVRSHLADEMRRKGVRMLLGAEHKAIEKTATGFRNVLDSGTACETELVMFATGRKPNVEGVGLEQAGVKLNDKRAIAVDAYSKTSVDNIWAIGDVTDRMALTPVAIREAVGFVETAYKANPTAFDYTDIPTAVFSQPPVGVVGLSEHDARQKYGAVDIYQTKFRPMKTLFAGEEHRTLMKLVVESATNKVVGVHLVGPDTPEMIQIAGIAVKAGLTKAQWDDTCALHPSAAEELVTLHDKYVPPELAAAQ